jgi:hypothetical protein
MKELATQLLGLMDGLCETEQGRLAVAVLNYIATGEMKEPRGTERAFFRKACEIVDAHLHNIYINNSKDSLSQETNRNSSNLTSFDIFWDRYPSKVNKKRCAELWKKLKPDDALVQKMLESIDAWKRTRQWKEGYVPNPDTWLRGEKWNDEIPCSAKPRNEALNYEQTEIKQQDFDAMVVNLSEA